MKLPATVLALAVTLTFAHACTPKPSGGGADAGKPEPPKTEAELAKLQRATFAAGCFWCEEAVYESIKGVEQVISGYSGGHTQNPTYEETGTGSTGHAEAVEVYYDSSVVDFPTLLKVYFASIDPTQVNGQGPDHGSQYRSIIFYRNATEKAQAEQEIAARAASGKYSAPIAVEVKAFDKFWKAEAYHQDYVPQHPENPYVQHESIPRLKRTQTEIKEFVKPEKLRI
jgi:peptide-methionine (S)-S-oxide reductase